jgi:hypothetical protein
LDALGAWKFYVFVKVMNLNDVDVPTMPMEEVMLFVPYIPRTYTN